MNARCKIFSGQSFLTRSLGALALFGALTGAAQSQSERVLPGHLVPAAAPLRPIGSVAVTNHLKLYLGLALRHQPELDGLLRDLHDPSNPIYHQWLTPEQFTERFGPTAADYEKVVRFANQHGLTVTHTHANRMMVNVEAAVSDVEKAFGVTLQRYLHPTEAREFYAPDKEPTVDADVPLLHVAGLDNYSIPRRIGGPEAVKPLDTNTITSYATGSSPGGYFMGSDFRRAYAPGVTNTGKGQYIAVIDVGGPYWPKDIYMYETNAGLSTNSAVTNILLSGSTGIPPSPTYDEGEEVLDIDMSLSMAPEATILNYEGEAHDVFNQIALDNLARQMTLSYGFGIDSIIQQTFQEFVAQGQAMSQASGDGGADLDGGTGLTGAPYSTIVGGVSLTMRTGGTSYQSDTTWGGSGGGISGWGIPDWQQGIDMTTNRGSDSFRNYPDVAMPADNIFTVYKDGSVIGATGGTSAASPLWAGFMALINQQAASQGQPAVGNPNPAIYAIGKGPRSVYTNCFHDIASGNTFNSHNPSRYVASIGYDLCTGWGSPMGSNTMTALVGAGTNNFTFYTQGVLNLVQGASASAAVVMAPMNGLTGSVSYTIAGFPSGITATISPAATTNATLMTISTASDMFPGAYSATLTGTIGSLSHTVAVTVMVLPPVPGAAQINLAPYYNRAGISTDGTTFSGGLDGGGYSYSATLLGPTVSWNNLIFLFGPPDTDDVVACSGQVIPLPQGSFGAMEILAAAVQGNRTGLPFVVTYTDNSTVTYAQNVSDWATPQSYFREATALNMAYRDVGDGTQQSISISLYAYTFPLDLTKTVRSLTLPQNANVEVLAAALATEPVAVTLSSFYNRAGIYTDGTTFSATGGLDGAGDAYSQNLLGGSLTWSNTAFYFGPPNTLNIVSATNQLIALAPGKFTSLRMLASGVGARPSQVFVVNYSDGTSSTFVQGVSDWQTPQNYAGETKAVTMSHRDTSSGGSGSVTVYLYGYSFALNSGKTAVSLRLPNNPNVNVAALSLIPNWPPAFVVNPIALPGAKVGAPYSASLTNDATDLNGGSLAFAKVSGPAWLTVAAGGALTGTPSLTDAGTNSFVVSVTDPGGLSNTTTALINVTSDSPILSVVGNGTNVMLRWIGGAPPYQIQMSTNLAPPGWANLGAPQATTTLVVTPSNAASFFRVFGQ